MLGNDETLAEESFSPALEGLLEYPHYTRPEEWRGQTVPEVLKSGHHAKIDAWRKEQSIAKTQKVRPELLKKK